MATDQQRKIALDRGNREVPLTLIAVKREGVVVRRFTNGNKKVLADGLLYTPFPFFLEPPERGSRKIPTIKLMFSNVNHNLQELFLRASRDNATWAFDVFFVYEGSPETPFEQFTDFEIQGDFNFNLRDCTVQISPWNLQNRAMVVEEFDSKQFPAVNR